MNLFKIVFCFLWKKIQEVKLLDPMQGLFLILLRSSKIFSIVVAPIYIPNNSVQGFPFPNILSNICDLLEDSHSDGCKVISHYDFDLHFSNN